MLKKQRTNPPSRKKYEENNPVISFRVSKELHDRLQIAKEKERMSYTDVLKAGLGLIVVKMKAEERKRQEIWDKGWEKGIAEAEEAYAITFPCSVCGEVIYVDTDDKKEAIRSFISEQGWGHSACVNRR